MLSGRGLCDELITRPEESYRLWCVVVCDLENFKNEEVMSRVGSQRHRKKNIFYKLFVIHSRYAKDSVFVIRGSYLIIIFFFIIGINVIQNIVHYMMEFVFGRLLIRVSAYEVVLIILIFSQSVVECIMIHYGQSSFPHHHPPSCQRIFSAR